MPFLPLADRNPLRLIGFQAVTVAIIAACSFVFLWQQSLPQAEAERVIYALGMIPATILGDANLPPELAMVPEEMTVLTSMFLHGGWLHLIGNMLYLWIFGDNIEDALGHVRYVAFYVICGIAAAFAHAFADPASIIPTVGASGAIAGVLGGYLVLHPRQPVLVLFLGRMLMHLPAWIVLGSWIGLQLISGWIDQGGQGGGVAWWAHVGGFVAGVVLVVPFSWGRSRLHSAPWGR